MLPEETKASRLQVELISAPTLSYAMEQSGVPLVRSVILRNFSAAPLAGAELRLQLSPDLGELRRVGIPQILPGESADLGVVDYLLPPGRLRQVTETERARLVWSVHDAEGTEHARGEVDVQVLAYNQWPGLRAPPALLSSFVTPNHAVISQLLRRSAEKLGAPLDGYQSRDPERVRAQVKALWDTIVSLGLAYAEPPASFEQVGQKIRLPDQLLAEQLGCCLDLSVLFASCLEQMGLAPLIILVKGHAFPAVWLVDDRFPEGLIEDDARLRNQIALGQLLAFESTAAVASKSLPFEAAIEEGKRHLAQDETFVLGVDVRACRTEYKPLPLRTVEVGVEHESLEPSATPQRVEIIRILRNASTDTPTESPSPPVPEDVVARFRRWKDRLLDLTLRNKLLNFRPDAKGALPLEVPDLAIFEDLLASGHALRIVGRPSVLIEDRRDERLARARLDEADHALRVADLARDVLHAALPEDRLTKVGKELVRDARTDLEEGGVSTLYVAIGLLKWIEPGTRKERLAPLMLYPVSLKVDAARGRVTLERLPEEEPVANVTLVEKLRRDFGVDLAQLTELATDDAGLDIASILKAVRTAIQARPGFEVLEEAHIARFSFAKFLMWRDLEDNAHVLLENPVVRHVAGASAGWEDIPDPMTPERLDGEVPPNALPCVLDADSTQLSAVVSALRGRSFVLQGPPGTGKSQTITNLIAAALADGKRVLFVSEKMAALEVVHRRLQQVGLGDFCLELHSHKANKKDVLRSLGAALERSAATRVDGWDRESGRISELRARLNGYMEALHGPRPSGFTVFQANARLRELGSAPEIRVQMAGAESLTAEAIQKLREAGAEFAARAQSVEPLARHPWRLSSCADWSATSEDQVFDAVAEAEAALDRAEDAATKVEATLDVHAPRGLDALGQLAGVAAATAEGALPPAALETSWPEQSLRAETWLREEAKRSADEEQLLQRWTPELLGQDLEPLLAKFTRWAGAFFLFAWLFLFSARRALKRLHRSALPANATIRDDLRLALHIRSESQRLAGEKASVALLLDQGLLKRGAALHSAVLLPGEALRELALRSAGFSAERRTILKAQVADLQRALDLLGDAEARVRALAGFGPGIAWPLSDEPTQLAAIRNRLRELAAARRSFRDHCLYRKAAASLEAQGHAALAQAHAAGALDSANVTAALERNLLSRWLAATVDREPALREFEASGHDRLIEEFAGLDRRHLELSREYVLARLEERLPAPNFAPKEVALLRRELQKKMRHIATRRLLQSLPTLLPRLKSCFLMSPLSVAQYLPAGTRFDLVVFDEASQIGTHDAIGAVARGDQVVVVGDSRQLPPTAFFQRATEDEEALPDENDVTELESVLEEAQAKGLPQQMLGWHYRSRHDALIAFSNRHYYEDRLFVFPAARQEVEDLGVKWHPVPEGVFLSGGDRTNPIEAQRLVAHLVEQLRTTAPGTRSFGVVTFSLPQRVLIEDLLDEARGKHPDIEPHFAPEAGEPVFVKNLENVQGDERDEIYFSVGYAKDERGRLRMHFGPLSTSGGERRLNVAITRARAQLRVFSTLRSDDIDLSRTRSTGTAHLRAFLQFAASGAGTRSVTGAASFDSAFHREVHDALVKAGHRVRTAVGCAGYRVDLAIERPDAPGTFALGIELDGPRWASAKCARDRERLRRQVLASLGWRMHRVWSTDWARDPEREAQRLMDAVNQVLPARTRGDASPAARR